MVETLRRSVLDALSQRWVQSVAFFALGASIAIALIGSPDLPLELVTSMLTAIATGAAAIIALAFGLRAIRREQSIRDHEAATAAVLMAPAFSSIISFIESINDIAEEDRVQKINIVNRKFREADDILDPRFMRHVGALPAHELRLVVLADARFRMFRRFNVFPGSWDSTQTEVFYDRYVSAVLDMRTFMRSVGSIVHARSGLGGQPPWEQP